MLRPKGIRWVWEGAAMLSLFLPRDAVSREEQDKALAALTEIPTSPPILGLTD